MAFVAGLRLDRTAFEEVSQFAVECHKVILLYRSRVDSPSGLLLLWTCIGPVWFCHSSATLASNTFRSWYRLSPRVDCLVGNLGIFGPVRNQASERIAFEVVAIRE